MVPNQAGHSPAIGSATRKNEPEQQGQRSEAYFAAILGVTVDGLAGYLFWFSEGSLTRLAMGIFVHLLSGALVGILQWHCCLPTRKSRSAVFGILWVAFVPPIGAIAAAILLIKCAGGKSTRHPPNDSIPLTVLGELRKPPDLNNLIKRGPEKLLIAAREIRPLIDVLKSDDLENKSAAVDVMVPQKWIDQVGDLCRSLKSPDREPPFAEDDWQRISNTLQGNDLRLSVAALRNLLNAPEADVRFRSSIGLLNIEHQITESIAAARFHVQQGPVPYGEVYVLGLLYMTYACTELVDETTAAHYARLAIKEFERCEQLDPSRSTHLERARSQLLCRDYQGCLTTLASNPNPHETEVPALIKMEALFALGLYDDLRVAATVAAATLRSDDTPNYSLIRWWGKAAP